MAENDKQAHIKQRLEAMGVMQADDTSAASPVVSATKDSGFSGLAIMMVIAATLTGILIYWLTENSTMHQDMEQSKPVVAIPSDKPSNSTAPAHTQIVNPDAGTHEPVDRTTTSTTGKPAGNSALPASRPRSPAGSYAYRPAYPRYRAYPYPPAPPRYAVPPYQRYYMPPPGYRYPPPWPPRR